MAVKDRVGAGKIGSIAGVEEDSAGERGATGEGAGEVGDVIVGLDDGVVDGGVGDAHPSNGVGVGGGEFGEVNGLVGGGIAIAGASGGGIGELLIFLLGAETV